MSLQLNIQYVHSESMGYGRMGTNIARALRELGVTVYDHLEGSEDMLAGPKSAIVREEGEGRNKGKANVICWLSVPAHGTGWYEGQIPTLLTMWEARRLPEQFLETLHHFDTVVVPSHQNLELFSRFHDNVKYVPLGVDTDRWHYRPREQPTRYFRYLIGGSGRRKGTDLAYKAFRRVWGEEGSWGDGPIPILVMKNPRAEGFYHSRVQMISGKISARDEVDLYATAHCYVQPSRGEGFGLQPLQAIAQGCPTILTDAHGHGAYAHLGVGISAGWSKADYFIYGDAGEWWEPNLDELCQAMRDVYDNYDEHEQRAKINAQIATDTFTWGNTANGFLDALGRDRLGPYTGPGGWVSADPKKFKIITNVDHKHEVAGIHYAYTKGAEYWEMADVKRILFEAGMLDPACLDDHDPEASGLTDAQLEKAGKYRAQYSHCPTCGKPLQCE